MTNYYIYKENIIFKLLRLILIKKKNNFIYWERNKGKDNKYIQYPPISQYYNLLKESKSHLEKYFNTIALMDTDQYLIDYIKKSISYTFFDYYYYRKAVENYNDNSNNSIIRAPVFLNDIYEMKKINNKSPVLLIKYIIYMIISFIKICRLILICFIQKNKIDVPDVIYYQKKILPLSLKISDSIKDGYSIEAVTLQFSMNSNEYGINYLNNFHNSFKASIRAFILIWKYFIYDIKYFFMLKIPGEMISTYLIHSFSTLCLVNLKPLIFFGIMEKPPFILLNKYKYKWQKKCDFSDGFVYHPVPSLDYVYADVFYTMNDIEIGNINANGGRIGKKTIVGDIRNQKIKNSRGVSKDLQNMIHDSVHTVLVATNRLHIDKYFPLTKEQLNQFLDVIIELAVCNKDSFFIVKTKKGEYKSISPRITQELLSLSNVYTIHSDIPSLLEYNHFEDLIQLSDMLISMFFCSTVIWQALSIKIPVIACNSIFEHSFLRKYKNLEVRHDEMKKAFYYWKNISKSDFERFISEIDSETNVLKPNSLNLIIDNISNLTTESQ